MAKGDKIIRMVNMGKTFHTSSGDVNALDDINLDILEGSVQGIIGLSGAGKSTLVRCINYLEVPTSGQVLFEGKSLGDMSDKEVREARRKMGMIFQQFNLLDQRNLLRNVTFPLEIAGVEKKKAQERAMELLKLVGLEDRVKNYPSQLSGGQKQRVAIARVLATDPEILLCDEATSALDPQTTKSILSLLKEINEKRGITIVVITHEMAVVQEICSHVAVLDHGNLMETGTVEDLFRKPKTEAAKRLVLSGFAHIGEMKGDRKVRVTFDGHTAFEPIIGNIILEYKTPINILYADTKTINGNAEGEMILQLPQNEEIADKIVTYFKEKNLGVEEVDDYAR